MAVALFGSYARGEAKTNSDIDILVCLKKNTEISRKLYDIWDEKISSEIDPRINPQFVRLKDSLFDCGSFWYEIILDAIVLYEKDYCFSRALQKMRKELLKTSWSREETHGHAYWVKNHAE